MKVNGVEIEQVTGGYLLKYFNNEWNDARTAHLEIVTSLNTALDKAKTAFREGINPKNMTKKEVV